MVKKLSQAVDEITGRMEGIGINDLFITEETGDGRSQLAALAANASSPRLYDICKNFYTSIP